MVKRKTGPEVALDGERDMDVIQKGSRDTWSLIGRSNQGTYDIVNMTNRNRLLEKRSPYDDRLCKRKIIDEKDPKDFIPEITNSITTDLESDEDDEYWDPLTDIDNTKET